jgi:outer membrane protein
MTKFKTLALTTLLALSTTLSADFLRVEGGVGAWMAEPAGQMNYNSTTKADLADNFGYETSANMYAWVYFKHFIPIVPNVRLEYTGLGYEGTSKNLIFNKNTLPDGTSTTTNLTELDGILYYNILDNTAWMTVDLGLDIKSINFKYQDNTSSDLSETVTLPLAYLRLRVEIPATNIGLEADAKYISTGSSTVSDIRAKVDYTLDFIPVIQPGLEIGYRIHQIKLDESDFDLKADMDFSGAYLGLMVRF